MAKRESSSADGSTDSTGSSQTQRLLAWLGLVLGVGGLVVLTTQAGWEDVSTALSRGGPARLLVVVFYPLEVLPRSRLLSGCPSPA